MSTLAFTSHPPHSPLHNSTPVNHLQRTNSVNFRRCLYTKCWSYWKQSSRLCRVCKRACYNLCGHIPAALQEILFSDILCRQWAQILSFSMNMALHIVWLYTSVFSTASLILYNMSILMLFQSSSLLEGLEAQVEFKKASLVTETNYFT